MKILPQALNYGMVESGIQLTHLMGNRVDFSAEVYSYNCQEIGYDDRDTGSPRTD